jgi:hypothetical protein
MERADWYSCASCRSNLCTRERVELTSVCSIGGALEDRKPLGCEGPRGETNPRHARNASASASNSSERMPPPFQSHLLLPALIFGKNKVQALLFLLEK